MILTNFLCLLRTILLVLASAVSSTRYVVNRLHTDVLRLHPPPLRGSHVLYISCVLSYDVFCCAKPSPGRPLLSLEPPPPLPPLCLFLVMIFMSSSQVRTYSCCRSISYPPLPPSPTASLSLSFHVIESVKPSPTNGYST